MGKIPSYIHMLSQQQTVLVLLPNNTADTPLFPRIIQSLWRLEMSQPLLLVALICSFRGTLHIRPSASKYACLPASPGLRDIEETEVTFRVRGNLGFRNSKWLLKAVASQTTSSPPSPHLIFKHQKPSLMLQKEHF